ncbi:Uncharacterized protein Fot_13575 [Forsythia ovata]|uniref:Uncharacterized protein n=1 Tax=Forsythia ovata TaxID=205694 RepID=A0ABD1W455_9LAMI
MRDRIIFADGTSSRITSINRKLNLLHFKRLPLVKTALWSHAFVLVLMAFPRSNWKSSKIAIVASADNRQLQVTPEGEIWRISAQEFRLRIGKGPDQPRRLAGVEYSVCKISLLAFQLQPRDIFSLLREIRFDHFWDLRFKEIEEITGICSSL